MARDTQHDEQVTERPNAAVGKVFAGRYRIEELLGRGGMGSVFRAHDLEVDEVVALKILDAVSEAAVERFRREVRLARRVTHRNAARTYDLGEHRGQRFLTMEYVDGPNLRDWLRRRPSARAAIDVAIQVAAGLGAAHAAGVIHRDLKPSNILIETGGRVVITDFGIARAANDEITVQTQGLLGTPAYMAPEQVEGRPVDARADLYALALILVEMLAGKLPFRGDNPFALAMARLAVERPALAELGAIPAVLIEPLERCLERDPARRFASAAELGAALTEARAQLETLTGQPSSSADDWRERSSAALELTPTQPRPTTTSRPSANARALAVLPFRYRGPADSSYVADALLDELTDVLSMTRGLKVSGTGASARLAEAGDRDPRVLGAELQVDVVVDGTIQLAGKRLRIAARLLDVHTGFQLWSERFEGELEDVFDLQDRLGKRIAEALRVELEILGHGELDDPEALESYLRARQAKLHWHLNGSDGALAHYRRVLERAPNFRPAIAGYAIAMMRAWFMPSTEPDDYDWPGEAKLAVERALTEAPDFADTQIAAASWSAQAGNYPAAAEQLRAALQIAPTCALAHEYLGRLQIEAGRPERGLAHLRLALELEPRLEWCHADIARHHALEGDYAGYREHMDRLIARTELFLSPAFLLEMRVGAWFRDRALIARALAELDARPNDHDAQAMRVYGPPLLEPYDGEALHALHATLLESIANGRLRSMMLQLWAEQSAYHHDYEGALAYLQVAADIALVDLAWLDKCPLLAPIREDPRFVELRTKVRIRGERIWATA